MRAIQFMFYNSSLVLKEIPLLNFNNHKPNADPKYLVKVHYSPINPSDLGFVAGRYGRYQDGVFPKTAGFEGSGIIVDSDSEKGKKYIGKKVSFLSNYENQYYSGAWTDFTIVGEKEKLILPDDFDLKDCCCLMVNPLTALSFLHLSKYYDSKSVIHTAGASSLGRILTKILTQNGVEIINTVRKEKQVEELLSIGGKYTILASDNEDLRKEMKMISRSLKPKIGFDCIGGDITGIILENLSEGGTLYHYGNLSLTPVSNVLTKDLIFMNKTMKGFWLTNYLKSLSEEELKNIYMNLLKYKTSTDYFNVNIVNIFKPNEVATAIKTYRSDMGKGKIILDFSK